jgi:hypothetical protein
MHICHDMQIDVNGDGELEWSEFTQFCVEAGVTTRTVPQADFTYKFDSSYHDSTSHRGAIQAMMFDEVSKEMIVVEGGSSEVKLYKSGVHTVCDLLCASWLIDRHSADCLSPSHSCVCVCVCCVRMNVCNCLWTGRRQTSTHFGHCALTTRPQR